MPQISSPTVGVIGIGAIGALMAGHLIRAGYDVIAWDRRPEALESVVAAGGRAATGLRNIGSADIVFSIVYDDRGVEEIAFGTDGLVETLSAGSCHLVLSTISPGLARRLHERHVERGQGYLSTSMFGRPEAAAAAETMFSCSGPRDLYATVAPLLDVLGSSRWIGPEPEQAMLVKIIGNNMIHAAVELLREMYDFLGANGISMREAKESIVDRLFPGLIYQGYAELLMQHPERPEETHPMQLKDSQLCMDVAERLAIDLPLIASLHEFGKPRH